MLTLGEPIVWSKVFIELPHETQASYLQRVLLYGHLLGPTT